MAFVTNVPARAPDARASSSCINKRNAPLDIRRTRPANHRSATVGTGVALAISGTQSASLVLKASPTSKDSKRNSASFVSPLQKTDQYCDGKHRRAADDACGRPYQPPAWHEQNCQGQGCRRRKGTSDQFQVGLE